MNWDTLYTRICLLMAEKSQDPHSKYACVIVDQEHRILSTGYNGIPRGMDLLPEYIKRPDKYMYFIHAEANAILNAADVGIRSLRGSIAYVIEPPCIECLKALYQAGIREIVYAQVSPPNPLDNDPNNWRFTKQTAAEMGSRMHGLQIRPAKLDNS